LYERARENIRPMRFGNLHLLFGDGMQGYVLGLPMPESLPQQVGITFLQHGSSSWPMVGDWLHLCQ